MSVPWSSRSFAFDGGDGSDVARPLAGHVPDRPWPRTLSFAGALLASLGLWVGLGRLALRTAGL